MSLQAEIEELMEQMKLHIAELKTTIKILEEKLKQAEFERDEWRKVAER